MKQSLVCVLAACVLVNLPLTCLLAASSSTSPLSQSSYPSPAALDLWSYLPPEWRSFCGIDYDSDSDVNATIRCHLVPESHVLWQLADLRTSLNVTFVESTGLQVALDVQCETGGTISLPFPYRSPGLVSLTVRNCQLLDKYGDFNTAAEDLGDWLRVVDMQDCVWLNNPADLQRLLNNSAKFSSHYDCGQDSTLVMYIYRNISDKDLPDPCDTVYPFTFPSINLTYPVDLGILIDSDDELFDAFLEYSRKKGGLYEKCAVDLSLFRPGNLGFNISEVTDYDMPDVEPSDTTTDDPNADVLDFFVDMRRLHTSCRYEHIQVWDESWSPILSRKHFEYLVENSVYPELRVLNYSYSGLTEVPRELREWRVYFAGSQLQVMDLSHCLINEVHHIAPYVNKHGVTTKLDLRFNRISKLSLKMLEAWAQVPDFQVDIRDNPIDCTCDMKELITQLGSDTRFASPAMRFYKQQLSEVACAMPSQLLGVKVGSLTLRDLGCLEADLRAAIAVLVVVVVVLLILLALAVKYRREVRILMYTRVNILLPCGLPKQLSASMPEKTYDAFVAYAHQDSDWVLNSLLNRLEEPGSAKGRQPCKLCIHQRDFVVGKPIIDNIVDSIAASRHTIVVLTNSFVKSGWAMEELQQAYHQSMEERRRHLVVVVLEEVAQSDMGAVLRRCCKTFTYLHVSDSFFWDRLQYSIQIGDSKSDKAKSQLIKENGPVDDTEPDSNNLSFSQTKHHNQGKNGDSGSEQSARDSIEDTDFNKSVLFSDDMRSMSVDSAWSTLTTETQVCLTPDEIKVVMSPFDC